jgi:hypothetical protein
MSLRRLLATALVVLLAPLTLAAPEKWAAAIDKFTQADAIKPPAHGGVVFVGSSSIVKWATLQQDFPGLKPLNRGFGGSELADTVYYADRIVIPYRPRLVVVYAGDNDLQNGRSAEEVHASFQALCTKVHTALPRTRIVFIAIKPSPSRLKIIDRVRAANALIAATCARDPRLAFADIFTPMLDSQGAPRPELFIKDMLHLSPAGYAVWTPVVAALLKP